MFIQGQLQYLQTEEAHTHGGPVRNFMVGSGMWLADEGRLREGGEGVVTAGGGKTGNKRRFFGYLWLVTWASDGGLNARLFWVAVDMNAGAFFYFDSECLVGLIDVFPWPRDVSLSLAGGGGGRCRAPKERGHERCCRWRRGFLSGFWTRGGGFGGGVGCCGDD